MFLDALHDIKEYSAVCSVEENVLDEEGNDGNEDKSAEEIKQEKKKAKKEKKEKEKEEKEKKEEEDEEKEKEKDGEKEKEEEKEKEVEKEKEEEEGKEKQESQEEKGSKSSAKEGERKQRKDKIIKIRDGGLGGGVGAGGGEKKKKEKKGDGILSVNTTSTPASMKNVLEGNILHVTTSSLPSNKHTSAHTNTQTSAHTSTQAISTPQRKLDTNSHIRKYGAQDSAVRTCYTHQSTHRNSRVRTLSDTTVSSPVCNTLKQHCIQLFFILLFFL